MAEQITQDVVKEAQSMGYHSPIDDTATNTKTSAGDGETPTGSATADSNHPKSVPTTSETAPNTVASQVDGTSVLNKLDEDTVPTPKTESDKQPQSSAAPKGTKEELVNGDSGEHSAAEDALPQASAEVSGASDTDISRPGSVDPAKARPASHLRSNSLKKPTSFKSVSVTKNFLAKSAVSTPSSRPGDKGSATAQTSAPAQQTAKPRLVAKSGSGIGNVPRSSLKLNGAGSGPDASKVWNKNQPIPPPPPKQFTDEELKQQYGIHLATRLPADEDSKEAKWADIDDDEDDWAPDTVQWMDGTKSTVTAAENQPPPPLEEPKPTVKNETPVESPKPMITVNTIAPRPSSTNGTKTILKPGIHSTISSNKTSLVLKGQPEKPTLVAKPPAPATIKSPWAPLPPVEKVSPVQITPPVQQPPPPRFSQKDGPAYDAMPPPVTKEYAPDDFNRTWRDERANKELFNSHNGRYEPVNDVRRGSFRDAHREGNFRQPSVLQRPTQDGPAEPSAAFQTSRTSGDGPAWGRRRGSSNVSGEGGGRMSFDRRLADAPPIPINLQRRESQSVHGSDGITPTGTPLPGLPQRHLGEHGSAGPEQHPSWAHKSSPSVAHAQLASPYGSVGSPNHVEPAAPAAAVPFEDPVEVQKRLMHEKLERARLQKQKEREEEERQEAEKKERLRKKLEALGGAKPDEPKLAVKERSPARPAEKSPLKEKAVPVPVQSPPKPPVPTSEGEVAQYGMMKVHQPHPVKKMVPHDMNFGTPKSSKAIETAQKPSSSPVKAEVQPKASNLFRESGYTHQAPVSTFNRDYNSIQKEQAKPQANSLTQKPEVEARSSPQVLQPAPPSTWTNPLSQPPRTTWNALSAAPTSTVWGPPGTRERALGNGTFDSGYNRGQPRPVSHPLPPQTQTGQSPAIDLHQPFSLPPQKPPIAPNQHFAQTPTHVQADSAPAKQDRPAPQHVNETHPPGPIAPPASTSGRLAGSAWANFGATIRRNDHAGAIKAREDYEALGGDVFRPDIKEVYSDRKSGAKEQKDFVGVTPSSNMTSKSDGPPPTTETVEVKAKDEIAKPASANVTTSKETAAAQPVINTPAHVQPTSQSARSSRFFPRAPEVALQTEAPMQPSLASKTFGSPPPPETQSHPVFGGNSERPVVRIPRPSPRVCLPPPTTSPVVVEPAANPAEGAVGAVIMPVRPHVAMGARPLALTQEWQARFNGLLGRTTPAPSAPVPATRVQPATTSNSQSKPGSLAVAAASKAPLDVRQGTGSATVSLPTSAGKKAPVDDSSNNVTSRDSAEQTLLEEREFGSLPTIKLPQVPHLAANEPSSIGISKVRPHLRVDRNLKVVSRQEFNMDDNNNADTIAVVIKLANMADAVTKSVPKPRGSRRAPGGKPKRNYSSGGAPPNASQNPRSRKPSNYQGQSASSQSSPRPSTGSGSWSSNNNSRSTPPHSAWSRRAAPVH
ncbi:hypothetical protein GQ43DRAFT_136652 [Delitschia confertaspora ATCC 74209]|uniref:Uncharacterized protein n=1 Tax=Delitschia confertaspora ATCC 74209 TaxID=1513339 RepID=A0A9P4JT52_9PLEO|nr:hypothetical protein GQ43DRAFT_136652 [Delitschia confertaspora ATCC 74209]